MQHVCYLIVLSTIAFVRVASQTPPKLPGVLQIYHSANFDDKIGGYNVFDPPFGPDLPPCHRAESWWRDDEIRSMELSPGTVCFTYSDHNCQRKTGNAPYRYEAGRSVLTFSLYKKPEPVKSVKCAICHTPNGGGFDCADANPDEPRREDGHGWPGGALVCTEKHWKGTCEWYYNAEFRWNCLTTDRKVSEDEKGIYRFMETFGSIGPDKNSSCQVYADPYCKGIRNLARQVDLTPGWRNVMGRMKKWKAESMACKPCCTKGGEDESDAARCERVWYGCNTEGPFK